MALPSLTGQTTFAPHLDTRAESEPLITWDNLWMLPVGYLAAAVVVVAFGFWLARRRRKR